jgi:hypothetical protein
MLASLANTALPGVSSNLNSVGGLMNSGAAGLMNSGAAGLMNSGAAGLMNSGAMPGVNSSEAMPGVNTSVAMPASVPAQPLPKYSPDAVVQIMTELKQNPSFIEQIAKTLKDPLYESTLKLSTERQEQIAQMIHLTNDLRENIKGKSDIEELKENMNNFFTGMDVIISKEKLFANSIKDKDQTVENNISNEDKSMENNEVKPVESTLPSEDDYLKEAQNNESETPAVTPAVETPVITPAETPVITPAETPVTPSETPVVTPTETPVVTPPVETTTAETPTTETPTETPPAETPTETPVVIPTAETPPVETTTAETPSATETKVSGGKRPRRPTRRKSSSRVSRKTLGRKRSYR